MRLYDAWTDGGYLDAGIFLYVIPCLEDEMHGNLAGTESEYVLEGVVHQGHEGRFILLLPCGGVHNDFHGSVLLREDMGDTLAETVHLAVGETA